MCTRTTTLLLRLMPLGKLDPRLVNQLLFPLVLVVGVGLLVAGRDGGLVGEAVEDAEDERGPAEDLPLYYLSMCA